MAIAMRLQTNKREDGYTYYTIQYLGWPMYSLKPFRVVNHVICYDFFERGELTEYHVPNGSLISTDESMGLVEGIIPERFKGRNKNITQVA